MTNEIFFDTDCISAFLWVNEMRILDSIYSGRIVIPSPVYREINNPRIIHLKNRLDTLINSGSARIMRLNIQSEEYKLYSELIDINITNPVIGKGEASAISLAKKYKGKVASNNLSDVKKYVNEYELSLLTTSDIMVEAYNNSIITEAQGNNIWNNMLKKRRQLGAASFTQYLNKKTL